MRDIRGVLLHRDSFCIMNAHPHKLPRTGLRLSSFFVERSARSLSCFVCSVEPSFLQEVIWSIAMSTDKEMVVYLTPEGLKKLQEELEWRINVRRPEIAKQIEAARKEGDLSENAGYDEAKYQAGMNEGRIMELQQKLKYAVIIEPDDGPADVVRLGRTVTIVDKEFGDEERYTIVGSAEASPGDGKISNESPIGRALMGKKVGDVVIVQTPGGKVTFEIVAID